MVTVSRFWWHQYSDDFFLMLVSFSMWKIVNQHLKTCHQLWRCHQLYGRPSKMMKTWNATEKKHTIPIDHRLWLWFIRSVHHIYFTSYELLGPIESSLFGVKIAQLWYHQTVYRTILRNVRHVYISNLNTHVLMVFWKNVQ